MRACVRASGIHLDNWNWKSSFLVYFLGNLAYPFSGSGSAHEVDGKQMIDK